MNILYITHSDGQYGAAKSLKDLLVSLPTSITPTVITSKHNELNEWCDKNGISNYSFNFYECCYGLKKSKGVKAIKQFLGMLKMKAKYFINNRIAEKEIIKNINLNNFDVIHTNVSTIDIGAKLSQKYNIPHIWHIRESESLNYKYYYFDLKSYLKLLNNVTSKIIFISNYQYNYWKKYHKINSKKAKVIYDVIKIENKSVDVDRPKNKDLKFVFSGSSTPDKGLQDVLRAILLLKEKNNIANVQFDIFGDYTNYFGIQQKKFVESNGLEKIVFFKGFSSNLQSKLKNYDVGIVSTYREALGRAAVEYLKSGLCLIGTDGGATPEVIKKCSGIIYSVGNYVQLADAVEKVINNTVLRQKIAKDGKKKASMVFNNKKLVNELINVYKNLKDYGEY